LDFFETNSKLVYLKSAPHHVLIVYAFDVLYYSPLAVAMPHTKTETNPNLNPNSAVITEWTWCGAIFRYSRSL